MNRNCFVAAMLLLLGSGVVLGADPPPVQTLEPGDYKLADGADVQVEVRQAPGPQNDEQGKPQTISVLAVKGRVADKPVVINLPTITVKSSTALRCGYPVMAVSLNDTANFYLLVREHESANQRPLAYQKISVKARDLTKEQAGKWVARKLEFTSSDKTTVLSMSIVISKLDGELLVGPLTVTDVQAAARAEHESVLNVLASTQRPAVLPRTVVFSRAQMKYGLERNYYHTWLDRPLLVDRRYREPADMVTPRAGYQRILRDEVAPYLIDGLAFFPETKGRMGIFAATDAAAIPGLQLLPEFIPNDDVEAKAQVLKEALASASTFRINGKVLISSYVASALTAEQWNQVLSTLRQRFGDVFLFLPALTEPVSLRAPWAQGMLNHELIEQQRAYLRAYLDVCDGIYFNYAAALKDEHHFFDEAFYRQVFIPVFKSVLSEERYHGKLLGLSAYHSHSNADLAIGLLEDGTRTLRRSLAAAIDARPDVIIIPEWDEVNENTCLRPTVCNSRTSMRIMRYHMSLIRGQAPSPLPGDDPTMPNLIVSSRRILTLGERLDLELLHVPDGTASKPYTAQLSLLDQHGQTVHRFDAVSIDPAQLQEHRLTLATETLPMARCLTPVLDIRGYGDRDIHIEQGLPSIQLRATWNWDHKYVKQPLRDLLAVEHVELAWSDGSQTPLLSGKVKAGEELALVEVLGDEDEAFVLDEADEHELNNRDRVVFRIEYRATRPQTLDGAVIVRHAQVRWHLQDAILHQDPSRHEQEPDRLRLQSQVSPHMRWVLASIARSDLQHAELELEFPDLRATVPLRDVAAKRMISCGNEQGVYFAVSEQRRPLDMPMHLQRREASFTTRIDPVLATEQFHLRLTSVSGKTFRSRPLLLPGVTDQPRRAIRVYSDTQQAAAPLSVAAERVPVLSYEFDPSRGGVLLCGAGRPFWACLGGFADTTTARGGNGGHSASLYHGASWGYPANASRTAPQWQLDDGQSVLSFDGVGNFIQLPRESLPRRTGYTVEFQINPQTDKHQVLLLQRSARPTGLTLEIRNGYLCGSYLQHGGRRVVIDTDLPVPVGQWSTITVKRDLQDLTLAVNGRQVSTPCALPGIDIGPIAFGGFGERTDAFDPAAGNPGWFKGQLRSLRIAHE